MQTLQKSSSYDIVSLQNITGKDFVFEYNKSEGGYPYVIPANAVRRFPRFLAEHALKHLIDQVLNERKMKTNNETIRQELASQIVVQEEVFQQGVQKSEAERQAEIVKELNKPSDLEIVLKKQKERLAEADKVVPNPDQVVVEEEKEEEVFEELKDQPKEPIQEVKPVPTRREIYDYAEKTLKMTLDEKELKKLDKLKVEDLLKELGDPRESLA